MKSEEQIKTRVVDIDATLSEADPHYKSADPPPTDNPSIAYLRGYQDALFFVLSDIELIKRN